MDHRTLLTWLAASSEIMTAISLITFIGIVWWVYIRHRESDFAAQAALPFADDKHSTATMESEHV